MVEADFSGDYLNTENAKENDVVKVIAGGEYRDLTSKDGKTKRILNIPVDINGKSKTWSPKREEGKNWVNAFGSNTDDWVGKTGIVTQVKYSSFGETKTTIEVEPMTEEAV